MVGPTASTGVSRRRLASPWIRHDRDSGTWLMLQHDPSDTIAIFASRIAIFAGSDAGGEPASGGRGGSYGRRGVSRRRLRHLGACQYRDSGTWRMLRHDPSDTIAILLSTIAIFPAPMGGETCERRAWWVLRPARACERRAWDSNPRCRCRHNGFQDRRTRPLCEPSSSRPRLTPPEQGPARSSDQHRS